MAGRLAAGLLALASLVPGAARAEAAIVLPGRASQGALVIGRAPAGSVVEVGGRRARVDAEGRFAFGIGRDQVAAVAVAITPPGGAPVRRQVEVFARDWPIDRVTGVPQGTVTPRPEIAERIRREQARVVAARARDDARPDFAHAFIWPARGRISGRFGNQRVYNGTPGTPHSGMDIAAPTGTPVLAPAGGVVTFADPGLYLTGGTLLIDHGHGVSSNFLHLSRIDVAVGDRVEQGEVVAAVGSTGRSTGPHLHWGMNWFDVRIDPLLVLEAGGAGAALAAAAAGPGAAPAGPAAPAPEPVALTRPTIVAFAPATVPAAEAAGLQAAADAVKACLALGGVIADTAARRGEWLVLEEGGSRVELLLPDAPPGDRGLYLFWPGEKPGQAVTAAPAALADAARRAAADYYAQPGCAP